jgi:hypothetical protein
VGELLEAEGVTYRIVIIGGAAINLLGFVQRVTTDVDILAFAEPGPAGRARISDPGEALPEPLSRAALIVARDMGLDPHWLNTGPALQWRTGLPPDLESRVVWRQYGALMVGLASRYDLIFFKLYAAADDAGPRSVHFKDLMAMAPTDAELEAAARWIEGQDTSTAFHDIVRQVVEHARANRS